MYKNFINENLDSDPLYNEIEYKISQLDDFTDPLPNNNTNENNNRINWNELLIDTENLLAKGIDIRVILWRMRATLHVDGISSLYENIKILENVIINQDKDNLTEEDKQMLSSFSASLGWLSTSQCINDVKNSFLCPAVRVTVKTISEIDILQSNNTLTYPELITSIEKANSYFKNEKNIPALKEQLTVSINLLQVLEDFVNEYTEGYLLDCKLLIQLLNKLLGKLKSFDEISLESNNDLEFDMKSNNFDTNSSKMKSLNDMRIINTRSEAVLLLDNVLQYFQVHEPSHPAPILIKRAQKMIGMDFESIIKELLPESIEALKLYTGRIQEQGHVQEQENNIENNN